MLGVGCWGPGAGHPADIFNRLVKAYEVLTDEKQKEDYDKIVKQKKVEGHLEGLACPGSRGCSHAQ